MSQEMPATLLLIQTGMPPAAIMDKHGDLPGWFAPLLARWQQSVRIIRVFDDEPLPPPDSNTVAVITGSWAMVSERLDWSERTAQWIRQAVDAGSALFGVCYGHQLMAHALGGEVDYHPDGIEIGSKQVTLHGKDDPLLAGLPDTFPAHLTHMQTITRLPDNAVSLATSAHDKFQLVRYGEKAYSTQFHPEITPAILASIIHSRTETLHRTGECPDTLVQSLEETPVATALLTRFVAQHMQRES